MFAKFAATFVATITWLKKTAEDANGIASSKRVIAYVCTMRLFIGGMSDSQFFTVALLIAACLGLTLGEKSKPTFLEGNK